jgi:hypothetical protein
MARKKASPQLFFWGGATRNTPPPRMPRSRKSAPRRRRRSSAPRRRRSRSRASARFRGDAERTPAQKIRDDLVQRYDDTLRSFVATLDAYRVKEAPTQEEFVALCVVLQACARDLIATIRDLLDTRLEVDGRKREWSDTVRTKQAAFERIKNAIAAFARKRGIICSKPVVGTPNPNGYAFDNEANGILDAANVLLPR